MNVPTSLLPITIACVGACLDSAPATLAGPRVVSLLGEKEARSRTAALQLDFDRAVEAVGADGSCIALVPWVMTGYCGVGRGCSDGRCYAGKCWRSPVDDAFVADLSGGSLSPSRQKATVGFATEATGQRWSLRPWLPLSPARPFTLLVARCAAAERGVPLAPQGADERLALRDDFTSGSEAVATASLVSPEAGADGLPADLARVVVRLSHRAAALDGSVFSLIHTTWGARGLDVHARVLRQAGEDVVLRPRGPLAPGRWELRIGAIETDEGVPFFRGQAAAFELDGRPDMQAPSYVAELRVADGCAVVAARGSEAIDVRISYRGQETCGWGATVHHLALGVQPADQGEVLVEVQDLTGKGAPSQRLHLATGPLTPLRVTEVLANPLGPEPRQEFVEVHNTSADDVDLSGWVVQVGRAERPRALPLVVLRAGGRGVLVAPEYQASSDLDPSVAPLAAILRLDRSLGLANSGEAVLLIGPQGEASSYGGYIDTHRAADGGRSAVRTADCDVPSSWSLSAGLSTPGAPDPLAK